MSYDMPDFKKNNNTEVHYHIEFIDMRNLETCEHSSTKLRPVLKSHLGKGYTHGLTNVEFQNENLKIELGTARSETNHMIAVYKKLTITKDKKESIDKERSEAVKANLQNPQSFVEFMRNMIQNS